MRRRLLPILTLVAVAAPAHAADLDLGPRLEYKHASRGHEFHLSGAAVGAGADSKPIVTWAAQEGHANQLYLLRMGNGATPVRVNPEALTVEALHHPPRLAVAGAQVYISWSSGKAKPEGTLFASDLQLSRSLDGGRSFGSPLRVNEDRPISHSFDGLALAADGTVVLTWIDGHEGRKDPATWVARVVDEGTRVEGIRKVGDDTCVCCRVDAATGPGNMVALAWRRVFPGDIRDMVLAVSRDDGRTFGDATLVSADHWKINACPHRGGAVGLDAKGRVYMTWYTEGSDIRPDLKFAVSTDGRRFGPPRRLHTSATSIPDQARMAVDPAGRAVIVWEESTAVRRRILLRYTLDAGRTLSSLRVLSNAIKASSPDIAFAPDGSFLVAWHEEQFPFLKTV
ncbi:MAG TPA: sialidase family protein, partial [Methylomirabilota bacterium]|nr:sialidase family protein [Methylomirabilota bacterium]